MEAPSPARLFAATAGALLVVLGIVGFFYDASFGSLHVYEEAFAGLEVNGWLNLFYLATGSIGVLVAGVSSRAYSLAVGLIFALLTILGWGSGWLFGAIGVLGIAAALGTPRLKPRAKPAGQRA